jgi:hypothetical protein
MSAVEFALGQGDLSARADSRSVLTALDGATLPGENADGGGRPSGGVVKVAEPKDESSGRH